MTPPLKKLVIFGLSVGIGNMVLKQSPRMGLEPEEFKLVFWNAEQIIEAGTYAIERCNVKVDKSRMRQAKRKIDQVCKNSDEFDLVEALSFLFLGLNDLSLFCKDKETIKAVEDAALNFATMYDPNLENHEAHAVAAEKYERWIDEL